MVANQSRRKPKEKLFFIKFHEVSLLLFCAVVVCLLVFGAQIIALLGFVANEKKDKNTLSSSIFLCGRLSLE